MNSQEALSIRQCLIELGHPQPATPMKTNNNTANGILTSITIKQKQSKAIGMRFYWLKDRAEQGQFNIYQDQASITWLITPPNISTNHAIVRPTYLYDTNKSPTTVKGCVEILKSTERKRQLLPSNYTNITRITHTHRAPGTTPRGYTKPVPSRRPDVQSYTKTILLQRLDTQTLTALEVWVCIRTNFFLTFLLLDHTQSIPGEFVYLVATMKAKSQIYNPRYSDCIFDIYFMCYNTQRQLHFSSSNP